MKFVTSALLVLVSLSYAQANSLDRFIREAAVRNGFEDPKTINPTVDPKLAEVGRVFFETEHLSYNRSISCKDCHLDQFGSADGIPNGIGVGGTGVGAQRALSGGEVIPRNTLPLWGRGLINFDTLFWDGKIQRIGDSLISSFGSEIPSNDPLVVAIHLPAVEIREMITEDDLVAKSKVEKPDAAYAVYAAIVEKLSHAHPDKIAELAKLVGKKANEVTFIDIANSIAHFIRLKFAVRQTRFSNFVFDKGELSENEKDGARLFYGKAKCSVCHSGSLFSDLKFPAIPFPQIGSGKNGFGVDFGRFNVTHNTSDIYAFRTPPLLDVTFTAPYGHSGSVRDLADAIIMHFDPLRGIDTQSMKTDERIELYRRLIAAPVDLKLVPVLSQNDVSNLVAFLSTLAQTRNKAATNQ